MTDVGTGFLQAVSAFCATRLGKASSTTFKDARSLIVSLGDGIEDNTKAAYDKLKADIEADVDLVKPVIKAIEKQTALIGKMASEAVADAKIDPFTVALAGRIGERVGVALMAIDEAVNIVAKELAKDANGDVDEDLRRKLMGIWNPWVQPFKDLADGAGKLLDGLGKQLMGIDSVTKELADLAKKKRLTFDQDKFRVALAVKSTKKVDFELMVLNEMTLEAFLGFGRREFKNPSEEDKKSLVERDGKWWRADEPVFGLRLYVTIDPGLQKNPLLSQIMPGSSKPKQIKPSVISLDSVDGLYLGDGRSAGNERATLPFTFSSPAVEVREIALGLLRNPANEVTGLELTTVVAAKLGDAVGLQVGGAGVIIALDGQPASAAVFPIDVSPRWPEAIGVRVKAGPVKGGGYLERKVRTYGIPPNTKEIAEFGGVIQLEILEVGVFAIGILSPDPFSLVLVMGIRFPTAIELSFGFTFNAVGGLLAVNRTVNTTELIAGMRTHFIDRVLFPDDPVAEAPKILDQVAKVFPHSDGGFVVGPIVELGWGSQAKIIEAKIGIVLALPDPKIIILGSVRVRAPSKETPLTDFRCEVYGEISADRLLIVATLRDSKIAGINISGDLGLLIQWGGGGDFALSVGGFHPRYTEIPSDLKGLAPLTIDLSPPAVVKIIVKAYFAVTAGCVMAGIRGELNAELGIASARAWLQLDMIFRWVPVFGFAVDLDLGIEIKVFGHSFASISFKGSLEGTSPWKIVGTATVDVWFLPTFHFNLGPITWPESAAIETPKVNPLALVEEALNSDEAWKAILPADGDQLAVLGRIDAPGLVAHPLAALEVTQSRLPLETHIDRVGSAGVTAHRVALGLATTSAGPASAVSTVKAPFAPGQFLNLEDDALLARSGFDQWPSGCRVSAATVPTSGTPTDDVKVRWHTYFGDKDSEPAGKGDAFNPGIFAGVWVEHGLASRHVAERENPYLARVDRVAHRPDARVEMMPAGMATVRLAAEGTQVVTDLGVMTASQAAWVADTVNASSMASVTNVAIGVM
ncbi:MAG: hypothetical protein QM619_05695 [Micropruina sp.]|uniref:DUF6603 domain-containing protein n=1 Tax=Micropruina sp. TaxID=2737536 RepID=UPI0039E5AB33